MAKINISKILLLTFLILLSSIAKAIEVGGIISEDTIWSPENNPYHVTQHLTIAENATLRILPGVEVKLSSADIDLYHMGIRNHLYYGYTGPNYVSTIKVHGNIQAVGTAENPIIFTSDSDEPDHYWGSIFVYDDSDHVILKYCNFSKAFMFEEYPITISFGGDKLIVNNCIFEDTNIPICHLYYDDTIQYDIEINETIFQNILFEMGVGFGKLNGELNFSNNTMHNTISGMGLYFDRSVSAFNNYEFTSFYETGTGINKKAFFYSNTANRFLLPLSYSFFSKNNNFGSSNPLGLDDDVPEMGGVSINNTYQNLTFRDGMYDDQYTLSYRDFFVNYTEDNDYNAGFIFLRGGCNSGFRDFNLVALKDQEVWNNMLFSSIKIKTKNFEDDIILRNSVLLDVTFHFNYELETDFIISNCLLDTSPFANSRVHDGGGNIIMDSLGLTLDDIFVDADNMDYHLCEGSPLIDAGANYTDWETFPAMDDYVRVWDGDGDGEAVVDIGLHEYGAEQFGKIQGQIFNTETNEPVKYALVIADNDTTTFVVSDSLGKFEMPLPEGSHDLTVSRLFYETSTIYGVDTSNEEITELELNLTDHYPQLIDVIADSEDITAKSELKIYPTPFYPENSRDNMKISFSLDKTSKVHAMIYNIKGQKIDNLCNETLRAGEHNLTWNGKNQNNKTVSSGVYFVRLKTDEMIMNRKILVVK